MPKRREDKLKPFDELTTLNKALKEAKELLSDNSLYILRYAESNEYYLFAYGMQNGKPIFDNAMIKVDKENNIASYYIITEHLKEIDKMKFKNIDTK